MTLPDPGRGKEGMRIAWTHMAPGPLYALESPIAVDVEGDFIGLIRGFFRSYFVVRTDAGQIVEVPINKCRIVENPRRGGRGT